MNRLILTFFASLVAGDSAKDIIKRKNLFGVTNFKAATFQYLGGKPTTFIYGE